MAEVDVEIKDNSSAYEILVHKIDNCQICWASAQSVKIVETKCGHAFCSNCLIQYYEVSYSNFEVSPLKCPSFDCSKDISKSLSTVLSPDSYSRLKKLRKKKRRLTDTSIIWCQNLDCEGFGREDNNHKIECNKCGTEISTTKDDSHTDILTSLSIMQCPGCRCLVSKTFGCMISKCYCGTVFCMKCGKVKSEHHQNWICFANDKNNEISIWILLGSIFSYILFPFFPLIILFVYRSNWDSNYVKVLNEHPLFYGLLIFVFSPMIFVVALFYLPFVLAWYCVECFFEGKQDKYGGIWWLIKLLVYVPSILITFVAILLGFGLIIAFLPLYGFALIGHSLLESNEKTSN